MVQSVVYLSAHCKQQSSRFDYSIVFLVENMLFLQEIVLLVSDPIFTMYTTCMAASNRFYLTFDPSCFLCSGV